MKLLNIYGQFDHHTEAKIIGNREGLMVLKEVIERASRKEKLLMTKEEVTLIRMVA